MTGTITGCGAFRLGDRTTPVVVVVVIDDDDDGDNEDAAAAWPLTGLLMLLPPLVLIIIMAPLPLLPLGIVGTPTGAYRADGERYIVPPPLPLLLTALDVVNDTEETTAAVAIAVTLCAVHAGSLPVGLRSVWFDGWATYNGENACAGPGEGEGAFANDVAVGAIDGV